LFADVGLRLNLFPKQNHALVRKSLWICLPPYFSVRDIAPGLFFANFLFNVKLVSIKEMEHQHFKGIIYE
jgi:hypothetical protein